MTEIRRCYSATHLLHVRHICCRSAGGQACLAGRPNRPSREPGRDKSGLLRAAVAQITDVDLIPTQEPLHGLPFHAAGLGGLADISPCLGYRFSKV